MKKLLFLIAIFSLSNLSAQVVPVLRVIKEHTFNPKYIKNIQVIVESNANDYDLSQSDLENLVASLLDTVNIAVKNDNKLSKLYIRVTTTPYYGDVVATFVQLSYADTTNDENNPYVITWYQSSLNTARRGDVAKQVRSSTAELVRDFIQQFR